MAKNARLRKCPICSGDYCQHGERLLANELATIGTGAMNIDMRFGSEWVISLRRFSRAAFVELKKPNETMGDGQRMALYDMTDRTSRGMEQRAFIVWEGEPLRVETLAPSMQWQTLARCQTWAAVARVIERWIERGALYWQDAA